MVPITATILWLSRAQRSKPMPQSLSTHSTSSHSYKPMRGFRGQAWKWNVSFVPCTIAQNSVIPPLICKEVWEIESICALEKRETIRWPRSQSPLAYRFKTLLQHSPGKTSHSVLWASILLHWCFHHNCLHQERPQICLPISSYWLYEPWIKFRSYLPLSPEPRAQ